MLNDKFYFLGGIIMLEMNTTIIASGTSRVANDSAEVLGMDARLEYDGALNVSKRCPNRQLYLAHQDMADKDFADFEEKVNKIVDAMNTSK